VRPTSPRRASNTASKWSTATTTLSWLDQRDDVTQLVPRRVLLRDAESGANSSATTVYWSSQSTSLRCALIVIIVIIISIV